ncbi:putative alanine and proline rich membrane protein [Mycolicibacterium rhodesiae JS60]|nr:putative alanine and proline rich membrane protein [Mycolicibacterium rhodesiae JS60]
MSQGPYGPAPSGPAPWQGPPSSRGPSRLPTIIAIVIAVIAVAVAIGAWLRPVPKPETPAVKTYSEQEVADAKKAVCDAFDTVHEAVRINTGRDGGSDPTAILAVAANARLSMYGGAGYLSDILQKNPATPADLSAPVQKLADTFRYLTIQFMINKQNADLGDPLREADSATTAIQSICK